MRPIELRSEQRSALCQLKRDGRNHEERWRASVLLDVAKGLRRAAVAERNDCSVSGVDKVLIRFRGGGVAALRTLRFRPRRRRLDAAGFALLDQAMRQTPRARCPDQPEFDRSLWTLDLLVRYLDQAVGVAVTDDTVRRYLLQLGWTTRAPKLTCRSPDPEYAAKMASIGELRQAVEKGGSRRRSSCTATKRSSAASPPCGAATGPGGHTDRCPTARPSK
jgi:transposase